MLDDSNEPVPEVESQPLIPRKPRQPSASSSALVLSTNGSQAATTAKCIIRNDASQSVGHTEGKADTGNSCEVLSPDSSPVSYEAGNGGNDSPKLLAPVVHARNEGNVAIAASKEGTPPISQGDDAEPLTATIDHDPVNTHAPVTLTQPPAQSAMDGQTRVSSTDAAIENIREAEGAAMGSPPKV